MIMTYTVHMDSNSSAHDFGPYKTVRKAHEVFDLVSEIAPAGSNISIIMKEDKNA